MPSGLSDSVGFFITALIYIALLSVLASPGTSAAGVITTVTGALADLVAAATGGGSLNGSSSGTAPAVTPTTTTPGTGVTVV
ncbi:MAG TPA: hypothetical protein VGG50_11535 [Streptosporangiaceae bacterium]|jgi:hypothetical protein